MKKTMRISVSIISLLVILFAFNQCVPKNNTGKVTYKDKATAPDPATGDSGDTESDNDLPPGLTMPPMNSPTGSTDADEIDVGIKNFEQIYLSMSALTGVQASDSGLLNAYKLLVGQLPPDNNVQALVPAHQVAITKLASEYCERLVENATLRSAIWPTINFGQNPPVVFTATNKQLIIDQAISKFLPPLSTQEQSLTSQELSQLFDQLLSGESTTTSVTTRKVVKGMCIATLASAHTTLL